MVCLPFLFIHDLESHNTDNNKVLEKLNENGDDPMPEPGCLCWPEQLIDPTDCHQILQIFLPNMYLLLGNCKLHLRLSSFNNMKLCYNPNGLG